MMQNKKKFNPRKFEALVDEFGLDDGGVASFTFKVQSLKKGKIYLEANPEFLAPPNNTNIVIDDNSCWHTIGQGDFYEKFKEINEKKIEIEDFERVSCRIKDEGFHYCFTGYSNWSEIKDEEFHRLRRNYLESVK
jgi:hypothetical protein